MLDPISIAALSAIPAVAQGISGFVQSARSKDILKNLQRPTFEIPEAATQALNRSKNLASSMNLAGQSNVEQRLDQNTANALYDINQNSTSGVEALAALSGVYANQMGAENQLGLNAATDYERRQAMVGNELNRYAGYQQQKWDYDVNQPFQEKAAAAQALGEAGMRNKYEGLKGLVGVAATGLSGMSDKSATLNNNQSSLPADALTQNFSNNTPKGTQDFNTNLSKSGAMQGVIPSEISTGIANALGSVAGKSFDSYGNEMLVQKSTVRPKVSPNMTPEQIALFSKMTPEQLDLMAKMLNQ